MSKFIQLKKDDKLCPKCGSLARTRRLWSLLEDKISEKKILHFSPSKSIKPKLESIANIEYVTTDYAGEFKANKKLNIVAIDEPNNTYDLIICYHILEHIEHDLKAMTELLRILKPGGTCLIQTPFKTGEIYEDETIKTEEERLVHFGQEDHVRVYSVDGLIQRLESVGFKTHLLEFNEIENNSNGFEIEERSIEAVKPI
jgi:SAM-dependent methyltransferase